MPQLQCAACRKYTVCDMHHFIHRRLLKDHELRDKKFFIPLCKACHAMYHFDKECNGMRFLDKAGLIEKITEQCGNDPRWRSRVAKYEWQKKIELSKKFNIGDSDAGNETRQDIQVREG